MRRHHSSNYPIRQALTAGAACILALLMTGCDGNVSAPSESVTYRGSTRSVAAGLSPTASARARAAIEAAVQGRSARAFEDEILRLESELPEVGGAYWAENASVFVVHLTDQSAEPRLRGVLARQAVTWRVPPEMRQIALTNLRVIAGRYAFSSLVAWQQTLIADPAARGLWYGLDADEQTNRLRVYVATTAAVEQVSAAGSRLGIPLEAMLIRVEAPASDYATENLRKKYRPAFGGLMISNQEALNACTLGWNVPHPTTGEEGFLTAAHCIQRTDYGHLGTPFAQAYTNEGTLGTVQLNPPWNDATLGYGWGDDCQGYDPCTHADVMWLRHNSASNSRHTVARTEYAGVGDGGGSISIVGTFYPTAPSYTIYVGQPLNKMGRTTGWTSGNVTESCLFYNFPPQTVPCTHKAGMRGGWGDSGAPVFHYSWGTSITPLGLLWGGPNLSDPAIAASHGMQVDPDGSKYCTVDCYILLSDFVRIEMHLRAAYQSINPVYIP